MPDYTVIRYSVDLILRPVDTVSGISIAGGGLQVFRDGRLIHPMNKDGNLILMGEGRKNFSLSVSKQGYLPQKIDVCYDDLDQNLPILEFHMIPDETYDRENRFLKIEGVLPGLSELDAVWTADTSCMIREFDARKKILTVFNPHRLALTKVFYAVVNPDAGTYEMLKIEKQLSTTQFKISGQLKTKFSAHFPISRKVVGMVKKDGSYLLYVANQGGDPHWIVRCVADGQEWFQTVDFEHPQNTPLCRPEILQTSEDGKPEGGM